MKNFVIACVCGLLIGSVAVNLNHSSNEKNLKSRIDELNYVVSVKDSEIRAQDKEIYDLKIENNRICFNVEKTEFEAKSTLAIYQAKTTDFIETEKSKFNFTQAAFKEREARMQKEFELKLAEERARTSAVKFELSEAQHQIADLAEKNRELIVKLNDNINKVKSYLAENVRLSDKNRQQTAMLRGNAIRLVALHRELQSKENEFLRYKTGCQLNQKIGTKRKR